MPPARLRRDGKARLRPSDLSEGRSVEMRLMTSCVEWSLHERLGVHVLTPPPQSLCLDPWEQRRGPGLLEHARRVMADAEPETTRLYDRREQKTTMDVSERIIS